MFTSGSAFFIFTDPFRHQRRNGFFLSFWFGVRRRNLAAAAAFFSLALLVTFATPLLRLLGLL